MPATSVEAATRSASRVIARVCRRLPPTCPICSSIDVRDRAGERIGCRVERRRAGTAKRRVARSTAMTVQPSPSSSLRWTSSVSRLCSTRSLWPWLPCSWRTRGFLPGSARNDVQRERAGGRRGAARGGEELDPVAVRIGYLDTHETASSCHSVSGAARCNRSRAVDLVGVLELEAEVECAERGLGDGALAQREERAVRRCKDEQVLVVVEPFGEPEMPAVEGG